MENELKQLLKGLSERPIAYYPAYAKICGSCSAGVLLSQLLYWWGVSEGEDFYKTDEEFCSEVSMGLYEFRNAKKTLIDLTLVSTERRGMPAKTYYTINYEKVIVLITSLRENPRLELGKTQDLFKEKPKTIYKDTKNTAETTSEILSEKNSDIKEKEKEKMSNSEKEITEEKYSGKIKTSSLDEKEEGTKERKKLQGRELEIVEVMQKYVSSSCSKTTKSLIEAVPRAIKTFQQYFKDEAVDKLKEAIIKHAKSEWFRKKCLELPILASPKLFFQQGAIEEQLLPLVTNPIHDDRSAKRPQTEAELRQIEEDNQREIDRFMARRAKQSA